MASDFDNLMAGMGVKRMADDKAQAKPKRGPQAPSTKTKRLRASQGATAPAQTAPSSSERIAELERASAHLLASRDEAEGRLTKSKKLVTKLKKELEETRAELDAVRAELSQHQTTVSEVLTRWGFNTPAKRASLLHDADWLERIISEPALWAAAALQKELLERTVRVCAGCQSPDERRVVEVEPAACEVCGGFDTATEVRRFIDAALINGRRRLVIVGRDAAQHRQLRAVLMDKRLVLTQLPGAVRRDRASIRTDVEHADAVLVWDAPSVEDSALEIYRTAERMGEIPAGPVGAFLAAAATIIGRD